MKTKFLPGIMSLISALVPIALLAFSGEFYGTALIIPCIGIVCIVGYVVRECAEVKSGAIKVDEAVNMIAMVSGEIAFFFIAVHAIFNLAPGGIELLPLKACLSWLFFLGAFAGFYLLSREQPAVKTITVSLWLGLVFISICALDGAFDVLEYYTDFRLPALIGQIGEVCAYISAFGFFLLLFIGIFQDKKAHR